MILYYALGGGLGHLTRARAVLHGQARGEEAILLSGRPVDRRVTGPLPVIAPPAELDGDRAGLRRWLAGVIGAHRPDRILLDAFPAGILGEFHDLPRPARSSLIHVARILRWPVYRRRLAAPLPRFDETWITEDLAPDHRRALDRVSAAIRTIDLEDPPSPATPGPDLTARLETARCWLIVHTGPAHEIRALVDLARREAARSGSTGPASRRAARNGPVGPDARRTGRSDDPDRFLVVTPSPAPTLDPDLELVDHYPAHDLFPGAHRIVTAAGFNAVRQTAPFRERHHCLPFPRPLDDQPRRAERAWRERESILASPRRPGRDRNGSPAGPGGGPFRSPAG